MKSYEKKSLVLFIVFGLIGAWLFTSFGKVGEWLSTWMAIPPVVYFLATAPKDDSADK